MVMIIMITMLILMMMMMMILTLILKGQPASNFHRCVVFFISVFSSWMVVDT